MGLVPSDSLRGMGGGARKGSLPVVQMGEGGGEEGQGWGVLQARL